MDKIEGDYTISSDNSDIEIRVSIPEFTKSIQEETVNEIYNRAEKKAKKGVYGVEINDLMEICQSLIKNNNEK